MSESLKGFLRGLFYTMIFAILDYVSRHLGAIVSPTLSVLGTAVIGSLEHFLNDPNAPTDTNVGESGESGDSGQ